MMAVVLIMAVFVVLLNTSFGYFKKRIEGTKLTFNVGTLNYELECVDLENCEVVIPANQSKTFDINLTSLNKIDTKYELYYEVISPSSTENIIDGGHLLTEDLSNIGEISKNETKNISLVANNTGSDEVTIKLGIAPSLKNNKAELKDNQKSLNEIAHQKYYVYDYTGDYETFIVPATGYYKIEAWGAQGGGVKGGLGAYTSGIINLKKAEELYLYIGGQGLGGLATQSYKGGYNGGGDITGVFNSSSSVTYQWYGYTGGGATDIRLTKGVWNDSESLASRIMVAAGGGGLAQQYERYAEGGAGGTLIGVDGSNYYNNVGILNAHGTGGTQTKGGYSYYYPNNANYYGNFGSGGSNNTLTTEGTGGGGYYGGGSAKGELNVSGHSGGGGGSSYVSGYTGCVAITSESNTSPKEGCSDGTTNTSCSYHYSNKIFTNSNIEAGNEEIPTHDLTSIMFGNSGNGYARITLVDVGDNIGYTIQSDNKSGLYYKIPPNSSKEITINLLNLNQENSYYELYYKIISPTNTSNGVEGGYLSTSENTANELIKPGENKNISIVINNTGKDTVYIDIDAKKNESAEGSSLEKNELTLDREIVTKYYVFDYKGDYQTFEVPATGYYKIEAWGAQGGGVKGGLGAYTSGIINLKKADELYLYIGGQGLGGLATQSYKGGYNGGGDITGVYNSSSSVTYQWYGYTGGGATDIRLTKGVWNDSESLASRIMVAAGGGGLAQQYERYAEGGAGGTLTGVDGSNYYNNVGMLNAHGTGGTQTKGGYSYYYPNNANYYGNFGSGGSNNTLTTEGTGGGGYYGGGSAKGELNVSGHSGGGGGSSYVSGYTGCIAITSESNISPKEGCSDGTTDISCSYHYSNKIFRSSIMKAGNESVPTHDLISNMTGNSGNGYARITYLGNDTYTIVYNSNGGNGTMESSEALEKDQFTLSKNTFTKEGHLFVGWSISADNNKVVYKDMASVINLVEKGETVNLYAVWIDKYTVTFDVNGGNTLTETSKVVNVSSPYGELPTPTKDAYDFIGWYTEKEGGKQITSETIVTELTETLYAHWKARTLDVLAYVGASSIYREGGGTYSSPTFDITNFNTMEVSCGYGQTGGGGAYSAYLVTNSGNISLLGTKIVDISGYTGDAYISISTTKVSMSGWDPSKPYDEWGETNSYWKSSGYINLTKLYLSA